MATPPAPRNAGILQRYFLKKAPEDVIAEAADPSRSLKKTLGAVDLVVLGVGAIIGTGIFVLAGRGAVMAGPNIIFSFILTGIICALAGLAYAELAAAIPTSGSAYAYTYSTIGETMAWMLGWALVLEYAVGAATVAIGWSSYFGGLMESFGLPLPASLAFSAADGGFVNLPAMLVVLGITAVLVLGTKESARLTGIMVAVKVSIILLVIGLGAFYVTSDNLTLEPPPVDPSAWYSVLGGVGPVLGAAAIIFFAYIGFDAVSTTAEETKNPKKDLPWGILGSLAICTVLYILASIVLVGMVPYTDFVAGNGVTTTEAAGRLGEPFGYAFEAQGITWAANLIRAGAIVGITSVLLVLLMGGPRVFFALARDGLLPQSWSSVHKKFGTPYKTTIGTGVSVAVVAGFGTLGFVSELANIGTLFAFVLVCIGVVVLRYTKPDLPRPFRVPLNVGRLPVLALLGALLCLALMASLSMLTILGFFSWMGLGLVIYSLYGIRKSRLFGHVGRQGSRGGPLPEGEADVVLEEVRPSP